MILPHLPKLLGFQVYRCALPRLVRMFLKGETTFISLVQLKAVDLWGIVIYLLCPQTANCDLFT